MSLGPKNRAEELVYAEENLRVDFQHCLQTLLNYRKISRRELAHRAGMTEQQLSRLFSHNANPGLRTIARLFHALDDACVISSRHLEKRAGRSHDLAEWFNVGAASTPTASMESENVEPEMNGITLAA